MYTLTNLIEKLMKLFWNIFFVVVRARRDRAPGERGPSAEVLDKARGVLANNMSLVPSGGGSLMEE